MIPFEEKELLQSVVQAIFDKKGFNILTLDVRGVSSMTDYFIIAEGTVDRHVKALSRAAFELLSEHHRKPNHTEGEREGDWVVLDYGEFVIHFFIPELREKYAIEQIWKEGQVVDIALENKQLA
ncbi:MAG: hypothetical protein JWO53_460 [Chlamydiia bacterium]|nr:hypothetical protein [Chlamydiia bacterium]